LELNYLSGFKSHI